MLRYVFLLLAILCLSAVAVPPFVSQQGRLADASGVPLDGSFDITFRIYDGPNVEAELLWSEDHEAVIVSDGLYSVSLGSVTPFPEDLFNDSVRYLDIEVDGDGPMTPRLPMNSVPYAFRSGKSDSFTAENVAQLLSLFQSLPDADGDGETKVSLGGTDCDDMNPLNNSNGIEVCDGADNNCNGFVDEGFQTLWFRDQDGDSYGDPDQSIISCITPSGYVVDASDCDDSHSNVFPGATEVCDSLDNNCDGLIDYGVQTTWYRDQDGDGWGDFGNQVLSCSQPAGYIANGSDCYDSSSAVNPVAPEICDFWDNNCDGMIDPPLSIGCTPYYLDVDGDGYGTGSPHCTCFASPPYTALQPGDCNDGDPDVNPTAPEICDDGVDNDCDGDIDAADSDCP